MKSKKPKVKAVRAKDVATGDRVTDVLYAATANYVIKNGGSVAVIGGIAIVQEDSRQFAYGVMVRVLGRKPKFTPLTPNKLKE